MGYLIVIILLNLLNAELIKPENLDTLSKTHVLFEWDQEAYASEYNLQISSSNNFSELLLDTALNDLVFIDIDNLFWNNQYFWRVQPIFENQNSDNWINTNSFFTSNSISTIQENFIIETEEETSTANIITLFSSWYDERSIAFDKYGKEIWNTNNSKHFIVHIDDYSKLYGFKYPDNEEDGYYGNNVPMQTNFYDDILIAYENIRTNRHDVKKLSNENFLVLKDVETLGPIPIGAWTQQFQNLGYIADGETLEFNWSSQSIIELNPNGDIVWEWNFYDYFDYNEFDIYGGTWERALQSSYYDWTHSNSMVFDEEENTIYLSVRHLSKIIKINYPSGEIIWTMGLPEEFGIGNNNICTELGFSWQHDVKILDNGNLLFFDNGNLSHIINNTDTNISRIMQIEVIDNNYCNLIHEYQIPDEYYSRTMSSVQLLNNNNYLINARGQGNSHLFEINSDNNIVWNAYVGNVSIDNYRAFSLPSIYPDAFSVKADNFILNDDNSIIEVIDNQIHFTTYNHSGSTQDYSYNFTALNNEMFNNEQGNFILNPNESIILSFNTNSSEIDTTQIILTITPIYHDYAEKQLVFDVSNLNLNNTILTSNFRLKNIYPNPFNPTAIISYDISNLSDVKISIYNMNGQVVEVLSNKLHQPGAYNVTWNAEEYTSGFYFIKLIAGDFVDTQKIMLIK